MGETPNDEPVIGDSPPQAKILLSAGVYDKFKTLSLYVLPAAAALYFGLAQIWGFPKAEEVLGTVAVFETFLGAMMKISSTQYDNSDAKFDGTVVVVDDDEAGTSDVRIRLDPEALVNKDQILVKVKNNVP